MLTSAAHEPQNPAKGNRPTQERSIRRSAISLRLLASLPAPARSFAFASGRVIGG